MTNAASPKHVFMSYSRKDEAVMRRIATYLRKQGINVWVDNEKLVPGTPIWEAEIEKAIKAASAVIVILSPDSKNSEWVRREITFADQYRTRIFPILVRGDEESSITLRLITRQHIDIRHNEEVGMNSLTTALSFYLKEPKTPKPREKEKANGLASEKSEHEAAKVGVQEEVESKKPLTWQRRIILGGISGMLLGISYITVSNYDLSFWLETILIVIACSLSGLITYPHMLSFIFLISGFFSAGLVNYASGYHFNLADFIAVGALFGLPAGALISRILFWLKVIK